MGGVTIRLATRGDVAALVALRGLMFSEMGVDPVLVADSQWQTRTARWLQLRVGTERTRAVVAEAKGAIVSSAIGHVIETAPSPTHPTGVTGVLSNVATFPSHKDQGLGEECVHEVMRWFRDETEVREVEVLAAPQRRPIYDRIGFEVDDSPRMHLRVQRE
ncbi:GNAT family N-acetyltransferase [Kribbia dieselivorans]|uniref:GNAT family N-acetyltransferase n=1 Tax=Kribbia dieselivorans TaxID=331526 RepID=UPI0008394580|nr:GNAT family N-acetyltransferase [Kribbia dieselivorans]